MVARDAQDVTKRGPFRIELEPHSRWAADCTCRASNKGRLAAVLAHHEAIWQPARRLVSGHTSAIGLVCCRCPRNEHPRTEHRSSKRFRHASTARAAEPTARPSQAGLRHVRLPANPPSVSAAPAAIVGFLPCQRSRRCPARARFVGLTGLTASWRIIDQTAPCQRKHRAWCCARSPTFVDPAATAAASLSSLFVARFYLPQLLPLQP